MAVEKEGLRPGKKVTDHKSFNSRDTRDKIAPASLAGWDIPVQPRSAGWPCCQLKEKEMKLGFASSVASQATCGRRVLEGVGAVCTEYTELGTCLLARR